MIPAFSVLIPTYNRQHKLSVVLKALASQEGIEKGEVVVGIDGSTDGTEAYLKGLDFPAPVRFFRIPNSGRSVIRNRLIEAAKGEILLFIQDDIVVREGWLNAHLHHHQQKRGAVLGHITWYPEEPISPYMHWLENGGHMLNFSGLRSGDKTDYWHFYMGNLSVPADLVADLRFDERISFYGWEDILFGYNFTKKGNNVYYIAEAGVYHWDEYREEELQNYMEQVGKSAALVEAQYPGIGVVPPLWKKAVFYTLIFIAKPFSKILPQTWNWYLQMKWWFLRSAKLSQSSS